MRKRVKDPTVNAVGTSSGVGGRRANDRDGEAGAILILALAYLVIISLVVAMLSTWVSNNLNNSTKFSAANSLTIAASGMTDLAIQYVRYNPLISDSTTVGVPTAWGPCWGGTSPRQFRRSTESGGCLVQHCVEPAIRFNEDSYLRRVPHNGFESYVHRSGRSSCYLPQLATITTVVFDDYPPAPASSAYPDPLHGVLRSGHGRF